jgi:hypothetical protein
MNANSRPHYQEIADLERDDAILRNVARQMDMFQPIKPQEEIDAEEARDIRFGHASLAVCAFLSVVVTVVLIEIDPLALLF